MNVIRVISLILGLCVMPTANALSWSDLWTTRDQRAKRLMDEGHYAKAAQTFQRADWRAVAAYRAGDYQQAAQYDGALHTADGLYNAGNALAKQGKLPEAIAAYDKALAQDPRHQDALFNRKLVQALLDKQPQKSPPEQQKDKPQSDSSSTQKQSPSQDKNDAPMPPKSSQDKEPAASKSPQDKSPPQKQPDAQPAKSPPTAPKKAQQEDKTSPEKREQQHANEQWLRLIPDDPGGLLREKFLRDHLKRHGEDAL